MKKINFSKLNGQGNDFIIVNALDGKHDLSGGVVASMCSRHFGIGADGLIFVRRSDSADFFMDYYNHDGSPAEMCGNGIRCMARFIIDNELWHRGTVKIDTRAGEKLVEINFDRKTGNVGDIKVNMGKPIFESSKIPVNIGPADTFSNSGTDAFINDYPLVACGKEFRINCVSMGNPHCVIYLDTEEDLKNFKVDVFGPEIENNPVFPNKTNVEFVKITGTNKLSMRVWERGVGETLACGTGACASAVCSIMLGKVKKPKVSVYLPGGKLEINWNGSNDDVYLNGTVEHTFNGEYILR